MNFSIDGWFSGRAACFWQFGAEIIEGWAVCWFYSVCVLLAEWDDPRSGRRGFLAGGPHPARLQRRRTVLSGQPADALHRVPQSRTFASHRRTQWQHRLSEPKGLKGAICLRCTRWMELSFIPTYKKRASSLTLRTICDGSNVVKHIDQKSHHPSQRYILPVITSHDVPVWHIDI